jgi:hypothetical protein
MKTNYYLLMLALLPMSAFSQNTCATALPIVAGIQSITAINGTEIPDPICAANGTGATAGEWYTYTPNADYSLTVTTDLPGTAGTDTRFHVYSGTCGAFTCVAGDDDNGTGLTSLATFNVSNGITYYIAFDNRWSSAALDFELTETSIVVPPASPISFTGNFFPGIGGSYQISVVDMNGDFLDDIVTVSSSSVEIHYQQTSGSFVKTIIPTSSAVNTPSWSMAAGDIDKNGFNDLLYGGGSGVTFMLANSTGTGFTQSNGGQYVFSQRSNFVDINNDGHLDAFVCHDVDPNVYYINDGLGNLVFNQGGIGDHDEGGNYGSLWVDYDNDGDQDCFIAKCRGGGSTAKVNELHRNNGDGTFTDVSIASNMADALQTWSSAWNDYDNDGYMDAVIGASSTADGPHKVMRNNGDGTFSDVTAGSGWDTNGSLNIEHTSYDFDNDGFTDVFGGGNKIMFGNGDMTFTAFPYSFTNGSIGDLNNDGFLDIQNGQTVYFSDGNANNWIKVNMLGVESNSNGIGARVEIYGAWGKQIRDIRSGDGFRHMNTLNAHFGIGTATEIDSIVIKWPSGIEDSYTNPTINEPFVIVEGSYQLSTLKIDGKNVKVYPSPATDVLNIDNFEALNIKNMKIMTNLGTTALDLDATKGQFDISRLQSGMYILLIETNDGKLYSETFIKK